MVATPTNESPEAERLIRERQGLVSMEEEDVEEVAKKVILWN